MSEMYCHKKEKFFNLIRLGLKGLIALGSSCTPEDVHSHVSACVTVFIVDSR